MVSTPAQILNIGAGAGQNHFAVQVARTGDSTILTKSQADIAGGYTESPYFYATSDSLRTHLQAPVGGPTTSGSSYARCELRELGTDGANYAFDPFTGTHWIRGRTRITHQMANKPEIVIAQLHNGDADRIAIRTQTITGSGNCLVVRINGSVNTSTSTTTGSTKLEVPYTVGDEFDWMIKVVNGAASIFFNDMTTPVITTTALVATSGGATWYFKAGCYLQSATSDDASTEYGAAELSRLQHWHTGWPTPQAIVTGPTTTPNTAPTAPGNLRLDTAATDTQAAVAWSAATIAAGATAISAYRIYNGATLLKTVAATALAATLTGLTQSTTYNLTVRAYNGLESADSNTLAFTTLATPAPDPAPTPAPPAATRTLFGGSTQDLVAQVDPADGDLEPSTATFTAWTAMTGGTRLTDLQDIANNPVATITPEPGTYRIRFYGPVGYRAAVWLDDGAGNRWRFDPSDLAARIGGVTTVSVNGGTDQTGDVDLKIRAGDLVDVSDTGEDLMTAVNPDAARAALGLSSQQLNQIIASWFAANGGTVTTPTDPTTPTSGAAVYDTAVYDTSTYQ